MRKLFKEALDKEIVSLDMSQDTNDIILDIIHWLHEKRRDILSEVDFHEGGAVQFDREAEVITISGDNGLFVLERLEITEL
jgi:hypothetical protein